MKHFPVKEKFCLIFRKILFFNFRRKTLFSCKKSKISYYLLISFNFFFINFDHHSFHCYLFSQIIFLIENFYLSYLVSILLIVIYFYLKSFMKL